MNKLIIIVAKIELFAGKYMRQSPLMNNYRPIFHFEGARTNISGRINLINSEKLAPGSFGIAQVTFNRNILPDDFFVEGIKFTISEGGKLALGKGEILEVIKCNG